MKRKRAIIPLLSLIAIAFFITMAGFTGNNVKNCVKPVENEGSKVILWPFIIKSIDI